MAFKFNEYHLGGGGSGGGSAVLTELTVTENGVYDNPVISGGLEPIIWDGTIGDKPFVEFEPGAGVGYVKVSDTTPSVNDLADATFTLASGESVNHNGDTSIFDDADGLIVMEGGALMVFPDPVIATEMGIPGVGTYVFYAPDISTYVTSIVFPTLEPAPADGWNKVTVNVVGDIINVDALPTQHALQNKVYRVTNGDAVTYGITSNATVKRLVDGAWVELT